ncbi:IncP-type conjugal transfer protein TraG [Bradyrhizobium sp. CCBAU 45389]|uniref:IncP-type conjugal transfer protein TraG n=1 Tax=Bradyrhizobium sp. CCBAU 45389 TaxID=858429 RepID=UPI002306C581|nr:IncP-type conjugal transfer protein TraG [Bradyrhizobium sp. CCBAU 45389]MDA9404530.1 conjugal transfer protein TraG [Bradyrhizobium sp. CCBAU 45389]
MSGTKILWGQVIVVGLIVLLAIWGATEWTAWRLAYQPELGRPWFELWGFKVYYPPIFFWWWFVFDAYAPQVFVEGAFIAASGTFVSIAAAIGMSVWRAREAKNVETYGSARWAGAEEARAAGLLGRDGVVLGKLDRDYLRHDGPEHVLCFAPTRSGKGVGLVVPSLLAWPGSAIVHDIKGENWQLTAGFRSWHGRVLLFDPTNPESSAYNPLLEVRRGEWEVRDVQNVADVLVDPEGSLDKRNHWEKTSHSLLVGAILHVLYAEANKTLAGVAAFLSDPKRPIEATLKAMMTTPHLGEQGAHPVVASTARELLNKSENERSGVLSTAMSFLGLYRDPVVAQVTCRCDWRIADLIADSRPTTLYLVVPPSDISRTKPLIRLVLNQIGRRLGHLMVSRQETARPLLTPGEVMQLPPMDEIVMVAGTAPIRAKKVRYYEDRRFTERVLPPPDPATAGQSSRTDGWSTFGASKPAGSPTEKAAKAEQDTANSGLRREPELPDHVAIAKETSEPTPAEEFSAVLDDDEDAVRQSRLIRQQMRGVARQVAMDPNDGMEL